MTADLSPSAAIQPVGTKSIRTRALLLAALLLGAGTMHFVQPKFFDSLIPPQLPGEPRTYTQVSGVAELASGSLLLLPRTRPWAPASPPSSSSPSSPATSRWPPTGSAATAPPP